MVSATGCGCNVAAERRARPWHAVSVRWLMFSVNGLILLVPVLAVLGLRLYQTQFIRQTEIKLIEEAIDRVEKKIKEDREAATEGPE